MFIRLLCQTCVSSQNGLALSRAAPPAAGPGCSRAARSSGSCRRCRRFATRWRFAGASGSPASGSAARFAAPRRWRRRTGSLRELWLVVRRRRCRCGDGCQQQRPQMGRGGVGYRELRRLGSRCGFDRLNLSPAGRCEVHHAQRVRQLHGGRTVQRQMRPASPSVSVTGCPAHAQQPQPPSERKRASPKACIARAMGRVPGL